VHKNRLLQVYEWFLDLPVAIVLAAFWLFGAGLVGLCMLVLYLCWKVFRALVGT